MKTPLALIISISFFITSIIGQAPQVQAGEFRLPVPGVMVHLSPPLDPPILKGIKIHPENPFRFEFILDKGDSPLSNDALKDESSKLIKYFLASLTIPEKDLWVNLSPYEKDRIIPNSFGLTEMGRDLLAEDYMLKQIAASLIYPEDATGKRFWKRIYEEAAKRYGTTNIPVNTFNKIWIVPEKAVVYENSKAGTAYVVESKLKVMLEQDYLSLVKHEGIQSLTNVIPAKAGIQNKNDINVLGSQTVREIVIPELTIEVNENKNFTQLRQVYNSLILAAWYKKKIKDSILSQVYSDKNKVAGVNIDDPQEKERIYQQYLKAFKRGVYNYIKEEIDPLTQETILRKYFSGGFGFGKIDSAMVIFDHPFKPIINKASLLLLSVNLLMWPALAQNVGSPSTGVERVGQEQKIHNREYWLALAGGKDYEKIFSNIGEFINEPYGVDVLKEATGNKSNHIDFVFDNAPKYLIYDHGWKFFEWLVSQYPNIDWLRDFMDKPYGLRAFEVLAKVAPQTILDKLTGENQYMQYRWDIVKLKGFLKPSHSQSIQLILQIDELPMDNKLKCEMGLLIPGIIAGKLTLIDAERIVKDRQEFISEVFEIYKDLKPLNYYDNIIQGLAPDVQDFYKNPENLDALWGNLDADELFAFVQVYLPSARFPPLLNYLFPKLLIRLKSENITIVDLVYKNNANYGDDHFFDLFDGLSGQNIQALYAQIPLEQQLEILEKFDSLYNNTDWGYANDVIKRYFVVNYLSHQILKDHVNDLTAQQNILLQEIQTKAAPGKNEAINEIQDGNPWAILKYNYKIIDEDIWISLERELQTMSRVEPNDEFFAYAPAYLSQPWGLNIFFQALKNNPVDAVNEENLWNNPIIFAQQDPIINTLRQIRETVTTEQERQRLALLVDDLVSGRLTMEQARRIAASNILLMRQLKEDVQSRPSILGQYAVDKYLSDVYLRIIQEINKLHEQPDNIRFKSIESATPDEFYQMMIYGEEEVYTSTFNGLFNRMIEAMKKDHVSGQGLLESNHFYNFRSFVRMIILYGRLNEFLNTMDQQSQADLIEKFTRKLEQEKDPLKEASLAADALIHLKDPVLLERIQEILKEEYTRQDTKEGRVLYGLLAGLFRSHALVEQKWFTEMQKTYPLPHITGLNGSQLFDAGHEDIQRYYFYNDEDGVNSFASFLAQYKSDPNWKTNAYPDYVEIFSIKGYKVRIFANRPDRENEGEAAINKVFSDLHKTPVGVTHRGHSFHAGSTIEKLKPSVLFVNLGSCGGFTNIRNVLIQSPQAQIYSTKGTGTMVINDPILKLVNERIRKKGIIDWIDIWKEAQERYGRLPAFEAYVSPADNILVYFIEAYEMELQKLKDQKESDHAMRTENLDAAKVVNRRAFLIKSGAAAASLLLPKVLWAQQSYFEQLATTNPSETLKRFSEYKDQSFALSVVKTAISKMGEGPVIDNMYLYSKDLWEELYQIWIEAPPDIVVTPSQPRRVFASIARQSKEKEAKPLVEFLAQKLGPNFINEIFHSDYWQKVDYVKEIYANSIVDEFISKGRLPGDLFFAMKRLENPPQGRIEIIISEERARFIMESLSKSSRPDGYLLKEFVTLYVQEVTEKALLLLRKLIIAYKQKDKKQDFYKMLLSEVALRIIQRVNSLHESPDSVRFAILNNASAEDLYWIMVSGEQELYTSSFNGILNRFLDRLADEKMSVDEVLKNVGMYQFRIFVKLIATYGRLGDVLQSMGPQAQHNLLVSFVNDLDKQDDRLADTVAIADTLEYIKDSKIQAVLQDVIKSEYDRVRNEGKQEIVILYGLLAGRIGDKAVAWVDWFKQMAARYPLPDFSKLPVIQLFSEGVDTQRYFFYEDADGKASFTSFIAQYRNDPRWEIKKHDAYVKISSIIGRKINIFANLPERHEDGQKEIDQVLKGVDVSVWVHRGHSYHLAASMESFPATAVLVYLGSCGGYSSLASVLDKSPGAHVLATQGTGTMTINDPLLKMINEQIRQGKDLLWDQIWAAAQQRFSNNALFQQYVSPAKNQGVLFIRAYQIELAKLKNQKKDKAMRAENLGGIDLTFANMNLQTQNSAAEIKFHMNPAMLQQLQNAPGFVPVIINIQPLKSLSEFLGVTDLK